jgi:hypothetical protein
MRPRFHAVSLASLVGLAVLAAAATIAVAGPAPKIQFAEYEWHFGDMMQDEEQTHVFTFTNVGDAPLVVTRTHTSCGCTAAIATQGAIAPGAKGEIKVAFNSKKTSGEQSKTVSVYSNAPDSVTTLVVKAKVKRDLNLPNAIQFGEVSHGASATQETEISAEKGVDFKIIKVEGDAAYVKAAFEPTPTKEGQTASYKVMVTLTPDAPVGPINTRVRIFSNLEKKPVVEIPVFATVAGDLKISDSKVNFGTFAAGAAQPVVLKVGAPAKRPIKVTSVRTSTPDVIATLTTVKDGESYEVRCTVSPSKTTGRITGKLIIETDDPSEARRELQLMGFIKS